MLSNMVVGLFFGGGVAGWVYSKMYRKTGGNKTSALTVAGGAGFFGFLGLWLVLSLLFPS